MKKHWRKAVGKIRTSSHPRPIVEVGSTDNNSRIVAAYCFVMCKFLDSIRVIETVAKMTLCSFGSKVHNYIIILVKVFLTVVL